MTLQTRAWVTAAVLVALAVAGEFVGSARRRILRREVPDVAPPPLVPGQVLFRVKGPDGRLVPQAVVVQIQYSSSAKSGARTGSRLSSGMAAGFVILGPPEGEYGVRRLEISGASDRADEPLPFGALLSDPVPEGAAVLEFVLPPERVISGSFRRGSKPLPGVTVRARISYPEDLSFLAGTGSDHWHSVQVSDAAGKFRLGQLGQGPQEVSFQCPAGIGMANRVVESGTTLDIDLDAGPAHTVTVADEGGNGLGEAGVAVVESPPGLRGSPRIRAKGITDRHGKIRFHGLDSAAKYRLVATRPGASPGSQGEESDWTPSDRTVHFRSQRSVFVRVLDEKGSPHAGVFVTAAPAEPGRRGVSGTTGRDGRRAIHGLDAGPLKVFVRDTCSFQAGDAVVTRDVGATEKEVLFTLPRGAAISILRPDASPWSGQVRAILRQEGSNAAAEAVPQNGVLEWHDVDPALSYAAVLTDTGRGLAARVDGIRASGQPVRTALFPGLGLKVAVRWPEGAEDRKVYVSWGSRAAFQGTKLVDGTWMIRGLPPGKYFVGAACSVPGRKEPAFSFVEAEAGGEASIEVK